LDWMILEAFSRLGDSMILIQADLKQTFKKIKGEKKMKKKKEEGKNKGKMHQFDFKRKSSDSLRCWTKKSMSNEDILFPVLLFIGLLASGGSKGSHSKHKNRMSSALTVPRRCE